jgi:hypothetical protein
MNAPRAASLAWIERSLVFEYPDQAAATPETLRHHALSLLLIAEGNGVPIDTEGLIWWIHHAPGKDCSLVSARRWCAEYAAARRESTEKVSHE